MLCYGRHEPVLHLYMEQDEFLQVYTPMHKGVLYPNTNFYKITLPSVPILA